MWPARRPWPRLAWPVTHIVPDTALAIRHAPLRARLARACPLAPPRFLPCGRLPKNRQSTFAEAHAPPHPAPPSPRAYALRFGGPGIKKKACLRRICLKARNGDESDDEAQLDEECATSPAHLAVPGEQPPHTTLPSQVGQGSSSSSAITSEPQSEATSPALRP